MLKRSILVTSLAVGLLATPAFAAVPLRGRGPDTKAAMLALVVPTVRSSGSAVQVLNQLCEDPSHRRGCTPIKHRLQTALEAAVKQQVTWVSKRQSHAGQFWVFAPVSFGSHLVRATMAWQDPGKYGCNGWTRMDFQRHRGVWSLFEGVGVVGCSAVPVS